MSQNPYASNPISHAPVTASAGPKRASQNKRFINYLVDSILIRVFSFGAGLALGVLMVTNNMNPDAPMINVIAFLIGLALLFGYYIILEGCCGITLGKLLTKTHVVSAAGGKASFAQIAGRSLARMIPFEPLSFIFGDKLTGWHDSLSGTIVVEN